MPTGWLRSSKNLLGLDGQNTLGSGQILGRALTQPIPSSYILPVLYLRLRAISSTYYLFFHFENLNSNDFWSHTTIIIFKRSLIEKNKLYYLAFCQVAIRQLCYLIFLLPSTLYCFQELWFLVQRQRAFGHFYSITFKINVNYLVK